MTKTLIYLTTTMWSTYGQKKNHFSLLLNYPFFFFECKQILLVDQVHENKGYNAWMRFI
jgi:hypothetical protein